MHKKLLPIFVGFSLIAGCGGGGGSSSTNTTAVQAEKSWVRAHLADVYLWYNEIVDVPPANYGTGPAYFDALLVKTKDKFSFSMPLADAVNTFQEGLETGYGVRWGWASNRLYAFYVDPNSPAASSLTRGTELISINNQPVATLSDTAIVGALFPSASGTPVSLTYRLPATALSQTKQLATATFATTTVGTASIITLTGGGKAGYLLFNEHLRSAEQGLANAMTYFKQQGITELVLDMRYNTGGYLFIAQELASMIGGTAVQGKLFEKLQFNNKHPENDTLYSFSSVDSKGTPLPQLNLSRVFVLTGSSTCSASESVINGLLPFIPVIRLGSTTCGKPYGFLETDYGQNAYFAIQFEGVNANGTDNFKLGFAPTCQVSDDLNFPLGDIREARLDAALYYMANSTCPPSRTIGLPKTAQGAPVSGADRVLDPRPGLKLLQ